MNLTASHGLDVLSGSSVQIIPISDLSTDVLHSELQGVSDEQWTQFVRVMITAPLTAVSASNALGMFEIMPRRLSDMNLVDKLTRAKSSRGRTCWVAKFKPPLTSIKFLKSPTVQYQVFVMSIRNYAKLINDGSIEKPAAIGLSTALAILHKIGPKGLKTWETSEKFPATKAVIDKATGIF